MKYRILINREDCLGCGACTVCANWKIGDDYKARPLKDIITEDEYACNKQASEICPVKIISIIKE
jgi:ferredoxin